MTDMIWKLMDITDSVNSPKVFDPLWTVEKASVNVTPMNTPTHTATQAGNDTYQHHHHMR